MSTRKTQRTLPLPSFSACSLFGLNISRAVRGRAIPPAMIIAFLQNSRRFIMTSPPVSDVSDSVSLDYEGSGTEYIQPGDNVSLGRFQGSFRECCLCRGDRSGSGCTIPACGQCSDPTDHWDDRSSGHDSFHS